MQPVGYIDIDTLEVRLQIMKNRLCFVLRVRGKHFEHVMNQKGFMRIVKILLNNHLKWKIGVPIIASYVWLLFSKPCIFSRL